MSKNINSFVYSDPSSVSGLEVEALSGKPIGAYQYSDPSSVHGVDIISEQLIIEFFGGSADVHQNTRPVNVIVRVMDTYAGLPAENPADIFEYSLEAQGEPLVWHTSATDGSINVLDPDNGIAVGHMEVVYDLVVRVTRGGAYISPGTIIKTFYIDEVAPIVTATPSSGVYPTGQTVVLSVVDSSSVIIYYTTDGSVPDGGSNQYTAPISIPALGLALNFFAQDASGNQSLVQNNVYTLDNVAPTITYSYSDILLSIGENCDLTWDVDEDCVLVVIEFGGDGIHYGTGTNIASFNNVIANNSTMTTIQSSLLPLGDSNIHIYAEDEAGNLGHETFIITYSSQIPSLTVEEVFRPSLAVGETGFIVWRSDIAGEYQVRLGGANPGEGTFVEAGTVFENEIIESFIASNILTAGADNIIKLYITTAVNNIGTASVHMTVDTSVPNITLNHYAVENPFSSPFILTATAHDDVVAGIPTNIGENNDGVTPYSFNIPAYGAMQTDLNIGLYQYSDPSILQPLNVTLVTDTTPPIITNVSSLASVIGEILITWDTNELANTNLEIGLASDLSDAVMQTVTDVGGVLNHSMNITGLNPNTIYYFLVHSSDTSANASIYSTIGSQLTLNDVIISGLSATPTATTATVAWATNISADSEVHYSENASLSSGVMTESDISLVMNHSIGITGLNPSTTYYYKVVSAVGAASDESAIFSFATSATVDTISPTITNVLASGISAGEVLITWDTDEAADTNLEIGLASDLSNAVMQTVTDVGGVLHHSMSVTGLNSDTTYYFLVHSSDMAANASAYSIIGNVLTLDTIGPIVANVSVRAYKNCSIINWDTNEPATSEVQYGFDASYGLVGNDFNTSLKTSHEVLLTGLTENVGYHFNIHSQDVGGNIVAVFDRMFATHASRDDSLAVYATTDGSIPTVNNYGHRAIGVPLNIAINTDTSVQIFASDGFGNHSPVITQGYSFDSSAPIITFDSMTPILLGRAETSVIRFKVSEDGTYEILNQHATVLASGNVATNVWIDVVVSADDMVEGINHIVIRAEDAFSHSATLQIGHIIKDTIAVNVIASPAGGHYREDVYVDLIPQNLRSGEQVTIYYTTDGSMPDLNSPSVIGQIDNIHVANTSTIRWFSVDGAGNVSPAQYANYVLDREKPTVGATPTPGLYDEVIYVTLIPSEPSTIYYTLDDSVPTETSMTYNAPLQIMQDTVVRCFAKDTAGNISPEIYAFDYRISVLHDKRFKKVIGFQDKMLLETEVNELQDNLNRRIEELTLDVVGSGCVAFGFDLSLSEFTFECFIDKGRGYIDGKFVSILRKDQSFIPNPQESGGDKNYTVILKPNEPIFKPKRPGQPGWEEGVPEITSYRLEESYVLDVVEEVPDDIPSLSLYNIFRPATASTASDCTVTKVMPNFEPLCCYQNRTTQIVSELQANLLALGLEVESYKIRNLLGLKNAFVDTFDSTSDVDMSRSVGFKYVNTRFEL